MTLQDKLIEIESSFNNWIAGYLRKDLTTNNARIVGEAICKAIILHAKGEPSGTDIILGNSSIQNKKQGRKSALRFFELIEFLNQSGTFKNAKHIYLQFELLRDRTNPSSHSANIPADKTTLDDVEICNTSIIQILKWFYHTLNIPLPSSISDGLAGKINIELTSFEEERWREFEIACKDFNKKTYQYILISPFKISENQHIVSSFTKLPWRLILDFNPLSDSEENGLLYNFNQLKGQGYKKAFTIKDKIEFDANFPHYWFFANGQVTPTADTYKAWRTQYKHFLSDILYTQFNKGSRPKSRIVVLLDITPYYAEDVIEEFNRIDEANLQFILCSTSESYEVIFEKFNNVTLINISANDISNGIISNYRALEELHVNTILIPTWQESRREFIEVTRDHYDYLHSLGIEIVYKGIERSTVQTTQEDSIAFYRGNLISWKDLAEQKDIDRSALSIIKKRIDAKLLDNKLSETIFVHEAGAGGTTIARRIAFDFSNEYPTIVLKSYLYRKTIDALRIIYDQYTKGSLPLLIVVESFDVKESHLLYRDLSHAKKNAVILIVHRGTIQKALDKKFTLKAQLEGTEVKAFEYAYTQLSQSAKERIQNIPNEFKKNDKYITPVLYALTAFGKDYHGLEQYVLKCVDGTTLEQKKFAGFLCLIYYYTQQSVPVEIFSGLFSVSRYKCNLIELIGTDSPILELLLEEGDDEQYFNIWRPRYALVGEEAMKIILSGGPDKSNWKNNLAGWFIELINCIKISMPFLDNETLNLLNSLFIERPFPEYGYDNGEFTRAIHDLPAPSDGLAVFEALTSAYPNEAHFHGHFARFLYSDKIGFRDYDRAIIEAEASLQIYPKNSSLIHTLGMCYREKVENLIHTFDNRGLTIDDIELEVQSFTELACDTFDDCIDCDPLNIYGYESQIRVILKTLDFGFKLHQAASKESFITNPINIWYTEKLDKASRLLDEAFFVIEQEMKVENKERIQKSAAFIHDCEGLFFRTLGKHQAAKNKFEELVKNTPKGYEYMRPHFRRMFIICLLAAKTSNKDTYSAWANVSESELNQCIKYLNENIFEDPSNTQNIRFWLHAVRHLKNPPTIEHCISKLSTWTQASKQNDNSILEGYYYLYTLNAIKAISNGTSFDPSSEGIVRDLQEKMKRFIRNEKFCFEWYGNGEGILQMVNHRTLGDLTSDFFEKNRKRLREVTGRIKEISSSQQGFLLLDCGLRAFFVPGIGGFTERNINDRVKFYVGFRYDQIQAWSVILASSIRAYDEAVVTKEYIELKDFIDDPTTKQSSSEGSIIEKVTFQKLSGPKIVGKVNLEDIPQQNQENHDLIFSPESNKIYEGHITVLKDRSGFIKVKQLDRDVAFRDTHLQHCNFSDLHKGCKVHVGIDFLQKKPKTDSSGRNYIAKIVKRNAT